MFISGKLTMLYHNLYISNSKKFHVLQNAKEYLSKSNIGKHIHKHHMKIYSEK